MGWNTAADTPEVMASIDTGGSATRLVIADITVEDSWVSVRENQAACLAEWR